MSYESSFLLKSIAKQGCPLSAIRCPLYAENNKQTQFFASLELIMPISKKTNPIQTHHSAKNYGFTGSLLQVNLKIHNHPLFLIITYMFFAIFISSVLTGFVLILE